MAEALTEPATYPSERAPGCPFDPPPLYRQLQVSEPITRVRLWDGSTPWLITKHADQRALLSDPRLSSDNTHPGFPHINESAKAHRSSPDRVTFILMDDPEHARLRKMVTAPFTVRRIEELRPAIQRIVDGLLDDMLAGPRPVDLVQAFALPVPSLVICELLGVPYTDHDFFQRNSNTMLNYQSTVEQVLVAQANLAEYLCDLVGRKLTEPDDGLLSQLAAERVATGELTREELAKIGQLMLVAGHETTTNMITLGTAALLQHPDQLTEVRDTDDPAIVANAVEELLRYLTIVHSGRRRVALDDIEIGGHQIKAGEGVILAIDIGNRDPDVFVEPERLDIRRNARRHIAFGYGAHLCLGASLARVELQVVYSTLFRRIPGIQLATDIAEVPFKHDGFFYGVHELPVTW